MVFVALGTAATGLGRLIQTYQQEAIILTGVLFIVFGLFLTGIFRPMAMLREYRFIALSDRVPKSLFSVVAGVGFGAAWTPCIGPYLGSILALAATAESINAGVAMLSVYSAGLAIPFLLGAVGLEWIFRKFAGRQRILHKVQQTGGVLLIIIGIALVAGLYQHVTQVLIRLFNTT